MPALLSPNVYADDRRRLEQLPVEDRMHLMQLAALINRRDVGRDVWRVYLTTTERNKFREDFELTHGRWQTLGIWAIAKGLPPIRALLQLARLLNYSSPAKLDAIALQLNYLVIDPEQQLERLRTENDLVVVEEDFAVYWRGDKIDIPWKRHPGTVEYLKKLFHTAKVGKSLTTADFGEDADDDVLHNRKAQLGRVKGFPRELFELIEAERGVGHRLLIDPERIAIVVSDDSKRLSVLV